MADVSKVKINNTTYDIKDPTKVSKSGDTMTNALIIEDDGITEKRTTADVLVAPDNTIYAIPVSTKDKNDKMYGYIQTTMYSDGMVSQQIAARNWTDENTSVTNGLALRVASDGTRSINFTNSSIWLNALGLSDSGWLTLTDNTKFSGTINYRKFGNQLQVSADSIKLQSALSANSSRVLAQLPSGYRPAKVAVGCGYSDLASNRTINVILWTDGNIELFTNGTQIAISNNVFFSVTEMI